MYKHILIATDGSDLAGKGASAGLALAKELKAKVTAISATEPWSAMVLGEAAAFNFPIDEYEKAAAETAERILSRVREAAVRLDVECQTVHVNDVPAERLLGTRCLLRNNCVKHQVATRLAAPGSMRGTVVRRL